MKKAYLLIIATLMLMLAGCSTSGHLYSPNGQCITCWNNPITGKAINHDGTTNQISSQTDGNGSKSKHQISFTVRASINPVYRIIKKEFKYQTRDEIQTQWGIKADNIFKSPDYHYEGVSGRYYQMLSRRTHNGHLMNIESRLDYKSQRETIITMTYWISDSKINPTALSASLESRVRKAIRG